MCPVLAIMVGASTSDAGKGQDPLLGAADAVSAMTEFLVERFGTELQMWLLCDENATRRGLDNALVAAQQVAAQQVATGHQLFVLLFSGHGLLAPSGQAWGLFGADTFDDFALARAIAGFPTDTEIALVSDACYGEGMFWAGKASRAARRELRDRELYNRSHQWSSQRVQADRHPSVCMAAAYPTSTKANTSESTLTRVVCDGGRAGATWKQLSKMLRTYKDDGRTFAFASRPRSVNGRAAFGR